MSGGWSIALTAGLAVACVALYLFWRFGAILLGRAKASDSPEARLAKWNAYIVPTLRKMMKAELAVGTAGSFQGQSSAPRSIATWSLAPTILPDVEFLALATVDDEEPVVRAIGSATQVRAFLGDVVIEQVLWGHRAFLYLWVEDMDLQALLGRLTPAAAFRAEHGLDPGIGTLPQTTSEPDEPAQPQEP